MPEGVGPGGSEDVSEPPLAGTLDGAQHWKLELVVPVLDALGSPDLVLLVEDGSADDGDGIGGSAVVAGHFGVELADSAVEGDIAVLLVHVVVARAGLIPQHNAEGLDMGGLALEDLVDGQDLSLGALGLELAAKMVPELGLGDDFISGEEADDIDLGTSLCIGRHLAAEHEVLTDLE